MFGRLRLRLTLWYVGILTVTLVVVATVLYLLVAQSLDGQINDSLREVNRQAVGILSEPTAQAPTPQAGGGQSQGGSGDESEPGESHDGEEELAPTERYGDDFALLAANQLLGSTGDVFVLALDPSGSVVANPRGIPTERFPLEQAIAAAAESGESRQDVTVDDSRFRLLTVAVDNEEGESPSFVVTGKSLEQRDSDLRRLLVLLAIGGGFGLGLAGLGGVWVAGLAIRPVRQAFDRQRRFVADASHELRTPITVVRTNAEALQKRASAELKEGLEDIAAEAGHMGRLISDLLVLAQADRGDVTLSTEMVDIYDVIESAARTGRLLAAERGLELSANPHHVTVSGDRDRLRELLLILIDNAIKYTEPGGRITVTGGQADGEAELVVEDTGIGIPEEHLPRVFDRFYRVDKARSRAQDGIGLGLSIAQAIARAHGGTIEIRSAPGGGTTARVALPLRSQHG
jgi:two-component system sensor histidine kinase CiaH